MSIDRETKAFEELYIAHLTAVYRYAYLRLASKEAAEDVAQTVFTKAWVARKSYEERGKTPLAYLFTIARNTIIDRARRKDALPVEPDSHVLLSIPDDANDPRDIALQREARETVYSALRHLGDESQEILTLRYLAELEYADIAAITGKSEVAIRQSVSRSLKDLRKIVEENKNRHG